MRPLAQSLGKSATGRLPAIEISARLLLILWICTTGGLCSGQSNGILCTGGEGRFARTSSDGVMVVVEAQKSRGLSTRSCEATLLRKKTETPVARNVWQADVDVMGGDLGFGLPVVAFQIKQSFADASMSYEVYSLRGEPVLLRTITGGGSFRSEDTHLDGRTEIWATDEKAVRDFEGLPMANFDFPPVLALRFEKRRLMDVSAEFRDIYDKQIVQIRSSLDERELSEFKNSDGKLDSIPPWEVGKIRALQATKIGVLEIVWAYLYSGREQDAWATLAKMWPVRDVERIRKRIENSKTGGISHEVDGVSQGGFTIKKLNRIHVYDLIDIKRQGDPTATAGPNFPSMDSTLDESHGESHFEGGVASPGAISIYIPPPEDPKHTFPRNGVLTELVIDGAGKVASMKLMSKEDEGPIGDSLIAASKHWKFVPAMKSGRPVACRIRLTLSPYQ